MFSGKTEELIRRLKRARFANQKVEILNLVLTNVTPEKKWCLMTSTPYLPHL